MCDTVPAAAKLPRVPSNRLQAQLGRVFANLDDDNERLVYAEMLTKEGDARGEFIVVQCRIAGGEGDEWLEEPVVVLDMDDSDSWT